MELENLKYNYVFFDSEDSRLRINKKGYRYICSCDLTKYSNIKLVTFPLDYAPKIMRFLYLLHNAKKSNMLFNLPFKKIWYPFYFKNDFKNKKEICFIMSGRYLSVDYLRYLKETHPNAKFVKMHRDLVDLWKQRNPQFTDAIVNELFDASMSYDICDSQKYDMIHFDEFESKIEIKKSDRYPLHDVFFAGKAKDRLNALVDIYDRLVCLGQKPFFYITGVAKIDEIKREGIIYASKNMSYYDMLSHTINSKIVLEINQKGADGYTSRFLESVMYNKKLITNNKSIQVSPFYNDKMILIYETPMDISLDFLKNDDAEYNYKDEFSPVNMIKTLDNALKEYD